MAITEADTTTSYLPPGIEDYRTEQLRREVFHGNRAMVWGVGGVVVGIGVGAASYFLLHTVVPGFIPPAISSYFMVRNELASQKDMKSLHMSEEYLSTRRR